jgi:hypothetical protein
MLVPFRPEHDVAAPVDGVGVRSGGRLGRLVRFAGQLAVPDGKIGWMPVAARRGRRLAREFPIRCCLSVSPRPTSHLVARRIAGSLGIPWVADFALPWSDAPWLAGRPRFAGWLDGHVERSVVRSARHITVAYPDIGRGLCTRHGGEWERKISVVPTGFADDLFSQPRLPVRPKFTVVYPGNHFCEDGRHGERFLQAVDEWIGATPEVGDRVEFVFIGERHGALARRRATMAHPEVIRVEPFMSHRACVQAIVGADLCVVNTVGHRIPDKVYECMRAGRPILALTDPGSDLEVLVRQYSGAVAVPPRDVRGIRDALHQAWQEGEGNHPELGSPDPSVEPYSSRRSAEVVAGILDRLVEARRGPQGSV